jgi:Haemolymph juvenile hormone binding protein (JHBP)
VRNICVLNFEAICVKKAKFLGHAELGLPSINPLVIEKLNVIQDLNAVKLDAVIYNSILTGSKNITKLVKNKDGTILMEIFIPKCSFIGPYKVKGQLLKLSLEGQGNLVVNVSKYSVTHLTIIIATIFSFISQLIQSTF